MTRIEFLAAYPEFSRAPVTLIDAWIGFAASELAPAADKWGGDLELGIGLLAASRLASSPSGQNARLTSKDDMSTYAVAFADLQIKRASGLRFVP